MMDGEELNFRMAKAIEENIQAALPDGIQIDYRYAAAAALKVALDAMREAFVEGFSEARK